MKNPGKSVVAALLSAGALTLTSCGGGSDASSNSPPGGSISLPGTSTTVLTSSSSGGTLLVRLGTDNLIQTAPLIFRKIFVAIVTDTNGRAVAGATVTFNLRSGVTGNPGGFLKGQYDLVTPVAPSTQVWEQSGPDPGPAAHFCANEDVNFNAILDPVPANPSGTEDLNGNGLLDPPGVADVNPTAVTDASGFAIATISYPQNYATWTSVTLEASTTGSGATPARASFVLPGLASDYANASADPPGRFSPFGQSALCTNTL